MLKTNIGIFYKYIHLLMSEAYKLKGNGPYLVFLNGNRHDPKLANLAWSICKDRYAEYEHRAAVCNAFEFLLDLMDDNGKCPLCGSSEIYIRNKRCVECFDCLSSSSIFAGTFFNNRRYEMLGPLVHTMHIFSKAGPLPHRVVGNLLKDIGYVLHADTPRDWIKQITDLSNGRKLNFDILVTEALKRQFASRNSPEGLHELTNCLVHAYCKDFLNETKRYINIFYGIQFAQVHEGISYNLLYNLMRKLARAYLQGNRECIKSGYAITVYKRESARWTKYFLMKNKVFEYRDGDGAASR
jgi:hypothetical protein